MPSCWKGKWFGVWFRQGSIALINFQGTLELAGKVQVMRQGIRLDA